MGWGILITGRALSAWNRVSGNQKSIGGELKNYRERRIQCEIELETGVLGEIKRLNSKEKNIGAIRELVHSRFEKYNRLGSKLELQIVKELQQKTLAGEEVSYEQIERVVLDTVPKNFTDKPKENKFLKVLFMDKKIYVISNTVAVTSSRILKLTPTEKIKSAIPREEIINVSTTRKKFAKAGPLLVETKNGKSQNFGNLFNSEPGNFSVSLRSFKLEVPDWKRI